MIYIDYRPGTYGPFLEFVCNAYLADLPLMGRNIIEDPNIYHTTEYMENRTFRADTYTIHSLVEKQRLGLVVGVVPSYIRNTKIIRIIVNTDDLLPMICTSFSTPSHNGCMPENLETNTYNKLANQDHQPILDSLQLYFNDSDVIDSYNNVKAEEWPNIETVQDFLDLPAHIQRECQETYGIKPYKLTQETPDCPRHVLRDFFRNIFLTADTVPYITQQHQIAYHDSNDIFVFPYSSFLDKQSFLDAIDRVAKWSNYQVNYTQELNKLYDDFAGTQNYLLEKIRCDNIVKSINNNESYNLTDLNVISEAYISTKIDREVFNEG